MTTASHTHPSGAPLSGRSVVVTRTREQAGALAGPLEALGAEVIAFPVLETVDPEDWGPADRAIRELDTYDWIVLTSTNGVERFLRRFKAVGGSKEALLSRRFAAVGSATALKMSAHGIPPTVVPDDFHAEGLVEAFSAMGACEGWRVLVPRALEAREVLPESLRDMGCTVDVVPVYRVVPARPDPAVVDRIHDGAVDVLTFTSGAIARAFLASIESAGLDPRAVMECSVVASIGPVTTAALAKAGYAADVEAAESTMESLADAVAAYFSAGRG